MIQKVYSYISSILSGISNAGQKIFPLSSLRKRFRTGSVVSRLLRIGFEKKSIRSIFGSYLFAGVFLLNPLQFSQNHPEELAYPGLGMSDVVLSTTIEPKIQTESLLMQNPTAGFKGISTRFGRGHAGYDFRAVLGSDVYPIAEGVVKQVVHSTHGYGRRVVIEHADSIESLYAHMGIISVSEGDAVTPKTILGEVGMTGWTTGPHIHLEIYKSGTPVNPYYYIDLDDVPSAQS